ncbi:MAG TPA: transposase [Candidatus Accumulibacter phosphatis]|nr:transposase [Candidatus Accumulibacter phosphatis]
MKTGSKSVSAADGSLFTSIRWPRAKTPKRAEALANLERLIPWSDLETIVRRVYYRDQRHTGRPGYSAPMLLRCLVLCWFWSLSDDQAEAVILDSYATARFVGTDPWKPRPPAASTIREFRKQLEHFGILKEIRDQTDTALTAAGIAVRHGTIREPVFKKLAGIAVARRPQTEIGSDADNGR